MFQVVLSGLPGEDPFLDIPFVPDHFPESSRHLLRTDEDDAKHLNAQLHTLMYNSVHDVLPNINLEKSIGGI